MIDKFKFWKKSNSLTLAQAALLIVNEVPEDWDLLTQFPYGFKAIYQHLLEDAATCIEDEYIEDDKGTFHSVYRLEIKDRTLVKSFKCEDGFNIKVDRHDLDIWLARNKMPILFDVSDEAFVTHATEYQYTTPMLNILNKASSHFFNPRRNPDPKSLEIVDWIITEGNKAGIPISKNVAEAMFTIIKPLNHDPRNIRVE